MSDYNLEQPHALPHVPTETVYLCPAPSELAPARGSAIPASAIKVMCEAWTEMNTIRARDGVPYMHNGYKSDVSQEYWDDIMQRLDDEVKLATGRGCWLHPALYSPNGRDERQTPGE